MNRVSLKTKTTTVSGRDQDERDVDYPGVGVFHGFGDLTGFEEIHGVGYFGFNGYDNFYVLCSGLGL